MLNIYDIKGNLVKTLDSGPAKIGYRIVNWNGLDNNNIAVPSGVYLYKLTIGDPSREIKYTSTKKMLLLK